MSSSQSSALVVAQKTLAEIDEFSKTNTLATLTEGKGNFMASLALADGIQYLQSKLTPEVMKPLMALQGSPLGYRTDKDRNKDGTKGPGYDLETVRDVMIDVTIRGGFLLFGNEVNILAGRGYITREGFQGWFKRAAKDGRCTYPETNIGAPKSVGDAFLVPCAAKCKVKGQEVSVTAEIPVRGSGADQVIGKATRKILARLFERVTGIEVSEADVTDDLAGARNVTGTAQTIPAETVQPAASAEDLAAAEKIVGEHGEKATAFFLRDGHISEGKTWKDAPEKQIKRILKFPKQFLEAIGAA